MTFIFLDESGQFYKNNTEKYFVIATFTVGDPKRTAKRFHSWCKTKFPKKIAHRPEIKFSDSSIDDKLRYKTLHFISNLDVRIRFSFIKQENIPEQFRKKQSIETGLLYTHIVGETLRMYTSPTDLLFHVFCDQRGLKGVSKKQFVETITTQLLPNFSKNTKVIVEMVDSTQYKNIQIVDWIVGALAAYLNKKSGGDKMYTILRNNIIGEEKEMFQNYWTERF